MPVSRVVKGDAPAAENSSDADAASFDEEGNVRIMPESVRSRVSAFQSQMLQFLSTLENLESLVAQPKA
ncbi:hypothetical protein WJX84_002397 [Apatococcus fuscideae]|uniref:Uncharacterized protein n=1 Tax=Apatococcus fuscideae TaxID=2026836 RepID=A0AAW1SVH1_9CHLO